MKTTTRQRIPVLGVGLAAACCVAGCDRGNSSASSPVDRSNGNESLRMMQSAAGPDAHWFVDEAQQRGLVFAHESGHDGERFLMPESLCGGAVLADFDNDGDLDAYCVQSGVVDDPDSGLGRNQLFENDGAGNYRDISEASGADDPGYGMSAAVGDYDNDGDLDLYVVNLGRNLLLSNNGDNTFTDVTEIADVDAPGWSTGGAFLDYDRDGDLDLFVIHYLYWSLEREPICRDQLGDPDYCQPQAYDAPAEDVLYRNDGDGTFTNVTHQSNINSELGTALGIVCADFNNDGWPDIFVANDGMADLLWLNQQNGTFENTALFAGVAMDQDGVAKAGMGVSVADIDFDADPDLLVVNLERETDSLYRNQDDYFEDVTASTGLAPLSRGFTRFGVGLVDFNHDGWFDLYEANGGVKRLEKPYAGGDDPYSEPNLLLSGSASGVFTPIETPGGTASPAIQTSRGAAFGDVNNDGAVDVLVINKDGNANLLINYAGKHGNWVGVRLIDPHGRDAIGARLRGEVGGRTIMAEVRSSSSYMSASDLRLHFGLGEVESLDAIHVRWPDGSEERFSMLGAGAYHTLRQGDGETAAVHHE